jgi:hypothetical protein
MPIGPKVKGTQLAEWQLTLMRGLIRRGFRITSSGGDGASVERECQRLTAVASKVIEYRIKYPDPDYPDIIVTIWELDGNMWVEIQRREAWTKDLSKQRVVRSSWFSPGQCRGLFRADLRAGNGA